MYYCLAFRDVFAHTSEALGEIAQTQFGTFESQSISSYGWYFVWMMRLVYEVQLG